MNKLINRGTGAGGARTTLNGSTFEAKTSIESKLGQNKFKKIIMNENKYGYYYELKKKNSKIIYLTQSGFKQYFNDKFEISVYKQPDEAFLKIEGNNIDVKILEKKNQNVEGSVEDKLKTGCFNRKEYDIMLNTEVEEKDLPYKFNISYAFCISKFLQDKFESDNIKYKNMKKIMEEDDIKIFYGEDETYFDKLYDWILE